jgi:hypothetical protein
MTTVDQIRAESSRLVEAEQVKQGEAACRLCTAEREYWQRE